MGIPLFFCPVTRMRRRWTLATVLALLPLLWAYAAEDPHRRRSILYIADRAAAEVIALDRDSAEVIATIKVGERPSGLAARRDGDRIFVACAGSHTLEVIDGARRQVLDTIALNFGAAPEHVALGPLQQTIYVAATGLDAVYFLDAGSYRLKAEIQVGRRPVRLVVSPDGRRLYALSAVSGQVDIIDTVGRRVIAAAPVGPHPSDIAIDDSTGTVYVVRSGAPSLHSIDSGATQAREVSIDTPAEAIAVDDTAGRLVLASPAAARISTVVPLTGAATAVIEAEEVSRMALDPEGSRLYALSARRGLLLFVNRILGGVERELPIGEEPWDIILIP